MRRTRRTLVWRAGTDVVEAGVWFRDTFAEAEGALSTVHEYELNARVDATTHRLAALEVVPHVLLWRECTSVVPSTADLVGQPLGSLRTQVRRQLNGAHSCTHLNDTLRSCRTSRG
jgi:hypothetical protein